MKPKFEVGEVVLLRSESAPSLNGEYTVVMVIGPSAFFTDPYTVASAFANDGDDATSSYILDDPSMRHEPNECGDIWSFRWDESALRKKHQPGEMSFRDLMQSLKEPSHA